MNRLTTLLSTAIILCLGCAPRIAQTDTLAPTPPMGWNSWICMGTSITESEVKANADFMAKHLHHVGYEYIIVDAGWYAPGMVTLQQYEVPAPPQLIDEYGRLIVDTLKYPEAAKGAGFKPLADYIHSKGLKFGLHIMRGIPIQAVEQNTPIKDSPYRAQDIVQRDSRCDWYHGFYGIDMTKPGAQEYYNSIFELYASWGVDYVKADDLLSPVYATDEINAIAHAVRRTQRPIILSLSPGTAPIENAAHLKSVCQLWRISEDFWDNWESLKHQFDLCRRWAPYVEPGHWADADMLPIGPIAQRAMRGNPRKANFTPDEQRTMFTLWSMMRSPLMLGCHLAEMDSFTLSLVTNKEVIAIDQQSKNNRQWYNEEGIISWVASATNDSALYVALFNTTETPLREHTMYLSTLECGTFNTALELWTTEQSSIINNQITCNVAPHGVALYKVTK